MRKSRRALSAIVAVSAALAVATGIAWAAIPDSSGAVNACYATVGGALRAVDGTGDCAADETPVALGGPTRGYAFANPETVTLGSTSAVVGSIELGPGKYLVHGKVNVANLNFTALRGDVRALQPQGRWNDHEPRPDLAHPRARPRQQQRVERQHRRSRRRSSSRVAAAS